MTNLHEPIELEELEPSGSPGPSNNCNWASQISSIGTALTNLRRIEDVLQWSNLSSLRLLKIELESLSSFFNFLTATRHIVLSPDLGYLCVLPPEIIFQVLSNFDHTHLAAMARTSKFFNDMIMQENVWQALCERFNLLGGKNGDEYYPKDKPYKWICQSRLHVFKEGDIKNGVGMFVWQCKVPQSGTNKHENRYCGEWKDNCRDGFGTYYWCNGSLYAGQWKQDKREGFGTRTWPNGNKYVGEYKSHRRHGIGEFTFSNGSVFKGRFEDNKFVHGTYTWPNGRVYDGDWNNIYRHGTGSYWWPDGRTYVGEWKNDKRHGRGKYTWSDGDSFEGTFNEGKRIGKGLLRTSTGLAFLQIWKEDKFEEFNKGIVDSDMNDDKTTTISTSHVTSVKVDPSEDLQSLLSLKKKRHLDDGSDTDDDHVKRSKHDVQDDDE